MTMTMAMAMATTAAIAATRSAADSSRSSTTSSVASSPRLTQGIRDGALPSDDALAHYGDARTQLVHVAQDVGVEEHGLAALVGLKIKGVSAPVAIAKFKIYLVL